MSDITLTSISDSSDLSIGADVEGYLNDDPSTSTVFYITDISEDEVALQDTLTSFGYVRYISDVRIEPTIEE